MINILVSTINNARGRDISLPYTLEIVDILRVLEKDGYIEIMGLKKGGREIKIRKIESIYSDNKVDMHLTQISKKGRRIYSNSRKKPGISVDTSLNTYIVRTNTGIRKASGLPEYEVDPRSKGEILIEVKLRNRKVPKGKSNI